MNELSLHLERILPVSRTLAFRAHADPARLARWWGPEVSLRRVSSSTRLSGASIESRCNRPLATSFI
jgi:uncharacterized protein YndB with AHSA1/START domain